MKNSRNQRPKANTKVILSKLPVGFVDDLPNEDKKAISAVVGKPVLLVGYDDDGRVELKFTDLNGTIHFVWVAPRFIKPIK
jgi:hypothetical protein